MLNNYLDESEYKPSHQVYIHPQSSHSIFIGDIQAALDLDFIRSQGITTIVTAATGLDHVMYQPPLKHIVFPLLDAKSQNISKFFAKFHDIVQQSITKGNLLVHCAAGISRSSTLVIAYLMNKNNWSFKEAIAFVRKSRPMVLPNLGFERQLKEYERELREQPKEGKSFERRTASKTSEQRKHASLPSKQNILPEIGMMGRTQLKPKILDLFSQEPQKQGSHRSRRSNSERVRPDIEFYGTSRKINFKPLRSKVMADKVPMGVSTAPQESAHMRLKHSMPIERVEEVMVRRLQLNHLNDKKMGTERTERQLRIKPLHRVAFY